jgi:hypothetical protein
MTALGPVSLTGGETGPEGGAAAVLAMLVLALAVQGLFGARGEAASP